MKKYLLTLLLCAFAVSFAPVASAASESNLAGEELPFFKKKGSNGRYKKMKRTKKTYAKKRLLPKKVVRY